MRESDKRATSAGSAGKAVYINEAEIHLRGVSLSDAVLLAKHVKSCGDVTGFAVTLKINGEERPIRLKRPMTVEEVRQFVIDEGIKTINGRPGVLVSRFSGSQKYCGAVFLTCVDDEFLDYREVAYRASNGDYLTEWFALEKEE